MKPEEVVQLQVDAYNAHDAGAFAALCSEQAVIVGSDGAAWATGRDEILELYTKTFTNHPGRAATIKSRIAVGRFVVDEEEVLDAGAVVAHAAVVYEVADDLITRAMVLTA